MSSDSGYHKHCPQCNDLYVVGHDFPVCGRCIDGKKSVPIDNTVLSFTCQHCENTARELLDNVVVSGPPLCFACNQDGNEMSLDENMLID